VIRETGDLINRIIWLRQATAGSYNCNDERMLAALFTHCLCMNRVIFSLVLCLAAGSASASIINVGPGDSYSKIESAQPGDQVVIAPGTYAFRVYLTNQATPANPIVIQAQDPANRPVWDFGTNLVENAPGSYGAGDRGRGGWQFSGAKNYCVSGIVFRNCRTASQNSAGIRYYNGTTNLYIKDCLFTLNDNGMTGGTQDSQAAVEYSEFSSNGNLTASSPTHNMYIYGGYFALRYCYVHDSVQAENFHLRARQATLEYNWFARATNYEGDLMVDDDFSGSGPFSQSLTLRGNVFVQSSAPQNHSQVIVLFNDTGLTNLTLSLQAVFNTFIGYGGSSAFVHLANSDGTSMNAVESDNIIYGTTVPVQVDNTNAGAVIGVNNWIASNANAGPLAASVRSPTPGFNNSTVEDYTLATNSICIGAANVSVFGLPGKEYYQNEVTTCQWRIRPSASDLGAFQSGNMNLPIGPYSPRPLPALRITPAGASLTIAWPLFASDFRLFMSGLSFPFAWAQVGFLSSTSATEVSVLAPTTGATAFFRLQQ